LDIFKKVPQYITDKDGNKISNDIRLYDSVKARKERKFLSVSTFNAEVKSMPEYLIRITNTAQKKLDKLASPIAGLLIQTIHGLSVNPRPPGL
jgi:hypothetical protein